MKSQEESTMALNPQRFFMPSFCLRPLLLPWDCVDSLHLQNDASVLLCTTSKQTVTISRQRPPLEPTDQSCTVRRIARPGRWQECSLIFSFVVVITFLHLANSFVILSKCLLPVHIRFGASCPPSLPTWSPTYFLGHVVRERMETRNLIKFLRCRVHHTLEFPPLIFLLEKRNLFLGIGRATSITCWGLPPHF